jgi:BirA family biotin operon repressor/biotin-[acetyl-CoA-carboxylase] ligase
MIGKPFIRLDSVDSSNNHAKDQFRQGKAVYGTAFFAVEQTQGRGQKDRTWVSEKGANILLTVIIDCRERDPLNAFLFNAQIALSCCDFFSNYAGDETCIKWPNDIYWRDRKAGGILIENSIRDRSWEVAFVGIGININQTLFQEHVVRPVSLKQITGKQHDPEQLAHELCSIINQRISSTAAQDEQKIMDEYSSKLFRRGERVVLRTSRWTNEVTILGVNRKGQLLVQHEDEEALDKNDVTWLL